MRAQRRPWPYQVSEGRTTRIPIGGSGRWTWGDRPATCSEGAVPVTQHPQTTWQLFEQDLFVGPLRLDQVEELLTDRGGKGRIIDAELLDEYTVVAPDAL